MELHNYNLLINDNSNLYNYFTPNQWYHYGTDRKLPISINEISALCGFKINLSILEAKKIYLPLCRLLEININTHQQLLNTNNKFLNKNFIKTPFIIGITGSVAVGKSTTSRLLQVLLSRLKNHLHVDLITTDSFLIPNKNLKEKKIMHRKGFPESFNFKMMFETLSAIKKGANHIKIPLYSHEHYDIIPNGLQIINNPDIIILEGVNLLTNFSPNNATYSLPLLSDFIDFSIYVDAKTSVIKNWYLTRFMTFCEQAKNHPERYFHRFSNMHEDEIYSYAQSIWKNINEKNLQENILPFRNRANLILNKDYNHDVRSIALRKY